MHENDCETTLCRSSRHLNSNDNACKKRSLFYKSGYCIRIVRVLWALCERFSLSFEVYSFSRDAVPLDLKAPLDHDELHESLIGIESSIHCDLEGALEKVWNQYGENAHYFAVTAADGASLVVDDFKGIRLSVFTIGLKVSIRFLESLKKAGEHITMSYIKSEDEVTDHVVPIFVYGLTSERKNLDFEDKYYWKSFNEAFAILQHPHRPSLHTLEDMMTDVSSSQRSELQRALETENAKQYALSIRAAVEKFGEWGKYHLLCLSHCHKHLIPGITTSSALQLRNSKQLES